MFEGDYGIEANCFALRCKAAAFPEAGVLPNLGYSLIANLICRCGTGARCGAKCARPNTSKIGAGGAQPDAAANAQRTLCGL